MARITIEHELKSIPNRYGLTLVAAYRAREFACRPEQRRPEERENPAAVTLREIAAVRIGRELLSEAGSPPDR